MAGSSNITGDESIFFCDNMSFDGTERGGKMTTNGQLWIGSTASRHVKLGSLTSPDSSVTIGYSSPNITLVAGTTVATTYTADSGSAVPIANTLRILGSTTSAGTLPLTSTGGGNTITLVAQRSQAIAAGDATKVGLSNFDSTKFTVSAAGFVSTSGTGVINTLTPNEDFDGTAATPVAPQAGTISVLGSNPSFATVTETYNTTGASTGNFDIEHRAWLTGLVVDASTTPGTRGTFSTIAAALTAAVSGQDIFIRTGTYTENLTLKAGVNLVGFSGDGTTPNVTIIGNATLSTAGTVTISNIRLQTNSAALVTVSGSNASILNLNNCYLNCTNNTGISFTASNVGAKIALMQCQGDVGTTGITVFVSTSTGVITFDKCAFNNSGGSSTTSSSSAGTLGFTYTQFLLPVTTTSTSALVLEYSIINTNAQNVIALTHGGSGAGSRAGNSLFISGSATAVSIGTGATLTMAQCEVTSTNVAQVAGAGTLKYTPIAFTGGSNPGLITTTTQTPLNYGTYVPTLTGSATAGTTTYTTQAGFYTIVGNIIYVEGFITISAATGTGNAVISLPFTVKNLTNYGPIGHCDLASVGWTWSGAGTQLHLRPQAGASNALIDSVKSGAAANQAIINATASFSFACWYQI